MDVVLDEFKQTQRAMWAAGDYPTLSDQIAGVGELLVERSDIGPGLRYNTRIGPIRADLGYQLNPIPGLRVNGKDQTRRLRFHFSIGQAF